MESAMKPIVIVGGGLSGLACAVTLQEAGRPFMLFEGSERWGGRVGSDLKDGFILDRGFQVFLDAYPTASEFLDLNALDLHAFRSGALVAMQGGLKRLADPFRHPGDVFRSLAGPLPPLDLLRLARLALTRRGMSAEAALRVPDVRTRDFLEAYGFSGKAIDRFWVPFLGGIFLEPDLQTSSRMFHFVFSLFARGRATLPGAGMQAIPDQLAAKLPGDAAYLSARVLECSRTGVLLGDGTRVEAAAVVDARDPWQHPGGNLEACGTVCFYFSADAIPWDGPWLVLCPEAKWVNTLTAPTCLHQGYAPDGTHLISVSCLDPSVSEGEMISDLIGLFGEQVRSWRLLVRMDIPVALPAQRVGHLSPFSRTGPLESGVYRCGDFLETASIEGALLSGKRIAERILLEVR